jgi:hypothetical protein
MKLKLPSVSRIGTLALAFCAITTAQISMRPKLAMPPHPNTPGCKNCVRDLNGRMLPNPAPVRAFRSTHPCPGTGSLRGACPGYVVSRIKALKAGVADTPENMRWRTLAQAVKERAKESVR